MLTVTLRRRSRRGASYQKIWLELKALAWNNPGMRARLAWVNAEWRAVLTEAFDHLRRELGNALPLEALVMTFNLGIIVERLGGIDAVLARTPDLGVRTVDLLTGPGEH